MLRSCGRKGDDNCLCGGCVGEDVCVSEDDGMVVFVGYVEIGLVGTACGIVCVSVNDHDDE